MRAWARRLVFTHSYSSSFIGDDLGGGVDADAVKTVDPLSCSVQPVFDLQSGHLGKVLEVAGQHRGVVGEGDGSDLQILGSDPNPLVAPAAERNPSSLAWSVSRTTIQLFCVRLVPPVAAQPGGAARDFVVGHHPHRAAPVLRARLQAEHLGAQIGELLLQLGEALFEGGNGLSHVGHGACKVAPTWASFKGGFGGNSDSLGNRAAPRCRRRRAGRRRRNGRNDALREPGGGELIHFLGEIEDVFGSKGTLEQVADALGCRSQFLGCDQRSKEAPLARLHLPPKLLGGAVPFVVEVATEHGGIEVELGTGMARALQTSAGSRAVRYFARRIKAQRWAVSAPWRAGQALRAAGRARR